MLLMECNIAGTILNIELSFLKITITITTINLSTCTLLLLTVLIYIYTHTQTHTHTCFHFSQVPVVFKGTIFYIQDIYNFSN